MEAQRWGEDLQSIRIGFSVREALEAVQPRSVRGVGKILSQFYGQRRCLMVLFKVPLHLYRAGIRG